MLSAEFIDNMPKVELHVHLEGSIRPETLLRLAKKHKRELPASTLEELRDWYRFRDFPHFATIYWTSSECLQEPEDIESITRDFLQNQKDQNILHSEFTYTPLTIFKRCNIPFDRQIEAINRARAWGERELGITANMTLDLPREACSEEESLMCADWAISAMEDGVSAFGLGGYEVGFPPEQFQRAFEKTLNAGMKSAPHAGETEGPTSIWGSLRSLGAHRIGHGVRALEDPTLVDHLREEKIALEVCPSSNICLGVYPSWESHPVQKLIDAGLTVTINSDDPPMFDTTLTQEWHRAAETFDWNVTTVRELTMNAVRSAFVTDARRLELMQQVEGYFAAKV